MILLDTNVLSELMRPHPHAGVVAWVDAQSGGIHVSAITLAEINLGIALLPEGKRRDLLATAARQMFEEDFAARCLPFDAAAAGLFAQIVAQRRRIGRPITTQDAQIAAIALANTLSLATRNTIDFADIPGLVLLDPWQAG
ncbi:MAG: PilT protein domain-containing protein [bacterium]|nr:MAG: PilT protein domain-containing protein [bacterium]KAF0150178.1 MAG: PilT protein domain-containing protein [bacterium]KAF0169658.1 MAG: PilT protein domain-containing protein [bacterium]TXT22949.1 MAG: PilT protein domain-containing protein [bacterium]